MSKTNSDCKSIASHEPERLAETGNLELADKIYIYSK